MGDFFSGESESVSTLAGSQQNVQNLLGDVFSQFLTGKGGKGTSQAFLDLISGAPQDFTNIRDSAFRNLKEFGIPQINSSASQISGIQNSRRSGEIARTTGNVVSQLAGIEFQGIESARNRQLQTLMGLLGGATTFANQPTVDTIKSPSMFGQLLQLGGTIGAAALLGPAGGAAAAAATGAAGGGGK